MPSKLKLLKKKQTFESKLGKCAVYRYVKLKQQQWKYHYLNEINLQSELDTLVATLKQLETQRGEAQKRLDDLQAQVYENNLVCMLICLIFISL